MYELICTDAHNAGMSISVFCRNAVLNRKIVQRPPVFHDDTALVHELRNLNKLGNNLNQIARALNSGFPDQSLESEIRRALGDLAEWKYEIL